MKKIGLLIVFVLLISAVARAQAEVVAGYASITPFAGGYLFESSEGRKNTAIYGLRAGYNFTENWGMEGFASYMQTTIQDIPAQPPQNIYGCGIEGLYHFMPKGSFVPFIALGVGGIHYGYPEAYRTDKFDVDYGVGLKIFLTDNIALRADVRHIITFSDTYNDILATLGITFSFGRKKMETPQVKDEEIPAPKTP
ncbi:MAG: outer membrane beta-barrel protein [Smithella sp.]